LFWKKHFGPIRLYCNSKFLESISLYKLDLLYDEINVDILDNIIFENLDSHPEFISELRQRYWD
jgi:hypothetical protein